MKRYAVFIICTLIVSVMWAAYIPAGTILYLDASQVWTSESSLTASFSMDGATMPQEVPMTSVASENALWQVLAPTGGPWTIVRFYTTSGQTTTDLTWGGYQSLYVPTQEASVTGVVQGEWRFFTPLPSQTPSQLGISPRDTSVCSYMTDSLITLRVDTSSNYLHYQWFSYTNQQWTRLEGTPAQLIATLPSDENQDIWFLFTGEKMRIDGTGVINGDFEQGNTGFLTDYNYRVPAGNSTLYDEGVYTITKAVNLVHSSAPSPECSHDHTTGNGNMMAINGGSDVNKTVWQQTVRGLTPQTSYVFSAWVMNWDQENQNMAELEFSINGQLQGGRVSPQGGYGHWTQVYAVWNSGAADSASIRLVNFQPSALGNDFAIDDISLSALESYKYLYHVTFQTCEGPLPECTDDLVYRKWEDVLFCDNHDSTLVDWQWYLDNQPIQGANRQFLYMPEGVAAGEYYVLAHQTDGSVVVSCPQVFEATPRSAENVPNIPSFVPRNEPIYMDQLTESALVMIYDMTGRCMLHMQTQQSTCAIQQQLIPGLYIIQVKTAEQSHTQRLIVW